MRQQFVPFMRRVMAYVRLCQDAAELVKSQLFDPVQYRENNADLGNIFNPALHYLRRGAAEGRHPGAGFDGDAYRKRYPDVDMSDANPLLHYIRIGRHESRTIFPAPSGVLPRLPLDGEGYRRWIAAYDNLDDASRAVIRRRIVARRDGPVFLVTSMGASADLRRSLDRQLYPHWRFVAGVTDNDTHFLGDPNWDFLLRLPQDCQLSETALLYLAAASDGAVEILHADHDFLNSAGLRHSPQFHSLWEPDLGQPMPQIRAIGRATLLSRRPSVKIGHVPRILFHCASRIQAAPIMPKDLGATRWPLVSVIIPTRDNARILTRCLNGLLTGTDYPHIEIIIVDNASASPRAQGVSENIRRNPRVRTVRFQHPFNWSAMNNIAAKTARGDILLLLNDDVAVLQPDWLRELVALAMRPDIGIAGAKLLYPNGRVQHAGISLGAGAVARHIFRHDRADDPGHGGMLSQRRSVAAVTGACLAIRRELFVAAGGLEEEYLGVTNGDVDLCLRVRALGQRVVWTPFAVLQHHEAATRGLDTTGAHRVRLRREREYLVHVWGALAQTDPYLNPNLDLVGEHLAFASPPRHDAG